MISEEEDLAVGPGTGLITQEVSWQSFIKMKKGQRKPLT